MDIEHVTAPAPERSFWPLHLHEDWKRIASRSWSFRLAILGTVLSAVELGMQVFMSDPPIDPKLFAAILFAVSLIGGVARLVSQMNLGVKE